MYQSRLLASLFDWRSPPALVGAERYERMVFVVGFGVVPSGAGEALRLREKGEERKREVREGLVGFDFGLKETLLLISSESL